MKKFFKFIFWFLLILIAVILIGGFIFLKTFDLNKYKSYAEDIVYKQTGRKLSLNGEAGLKISLIPTVVLNDVTLSNADWAKPENMVNVKSVEVSLDILPLLKKELVINTVNLINPEINLAVNKNGTPNWAFTPIKEQQAESLFKTNSLMSEFALIKSATAAPIEQQANQIDQKFALSGIVAKHIEIENGIVNYNDMKSGANTNVQIKSFNLVSAGMNDNVNIDFDVLLNGENISGTATTGSINSVLQNHPEFPVKADVKAFGATAQADLKLNNLTGDLTFTGMVNATNPNGNFGAPAVNVESQISGSLKEIAAIINRLAVAGNVITGKINVNLAQAKPFITADLNSALINLQTLTAKPQTAEIFTVIGSAQAANFVPDTTLDLSALNSVNAKAKIAVKQLIVNDDLSVENIQLTAALNNGTLNVQPLSLQAGGGTISGSASVAAANNHLNVDLVGQNIVLQNMLKQLALHDGSSFGFKNGGKTDLKIQLSGQGATVRRLVESLSGQIIAIVGESQIQTGSLKYLSGNFITQILNSLNLKKASGMDLKCAVVRADLNNGNVQLPKGIVFNAQQMVVVGDGSVNLNNDKISFTIHPFNSKITDNNIAQAISSLLKVSGTIENPKLTLDNASVVKNVIGVAAAGPAYLGSQMILDADPSPCYTALKGTSYQNMFPAPEGAKAAGQGIYQGANELVNGSVNAITDTAKDVLKLFKKKK